MLDDPSQLEPLQAEAKAKRTQTQYRPMRMWYTVSFAPERGRARGPREEARPADGHTGYIADGHTGHIADGHMGHIADGHMGHISDGHVRGMPLCMRVIQLSTCVIWPPITTTLTPSVSYTHLRAHETEADL
eukprot:2040218-Rhodomonas_salina.1